MRNKSNLTGVEYFKYECQDEEAIRLFLEKSSLLEEAEEAILNNETKIELLEEQNEFAQELVNCIIHIMTLKMSKSELLADLSTVIRESMFEY